MDYGPRPTKPKHQPGAYQPPLPRMQKQRPDGTFGGPGQVLMQALAAVLNNQPSSPYKAGQQVGRALRRR